VPLSTVHVTPFGRVPVRVGGAVPMVASGIESVWARATRADVNEPTRTTANPATAAHAKRRRARIDVYLDRNDARFTARSRRSPAGRHRTETPSNTLRRSWPMSARAPLPPIHHVSLHRSQERPNTTPAEWWVRFDAFPRVEQSPEGELDRLSALSIARATPAHHCCRPHRRRLSRQLRRARRYRVPRTRQPRAGWPLESVDPPDLWEAVGAVEHWGRVRTSGG
jgi:hypothetical protein